MAVSPPTLRYIQFTLVMFIVCLAASFSSSFAFAQAPSHVSHQKFITQLTTQESAWLSAHPQITIATNNAWPAMD